MDNNYDVIIIGAGVSGYSAAIYCARFNLKTVIFGIENGGLLTLTHLVENWPGIIHASGLDIMQKVEEHVKDYDVPIMNREVKEIKKTDDGFEIVADDEKYYAKAIIYATGTKRKELNIPGEKEFYGRGVSYCATCDATFYKDKVAAVVGGSDSAAKEALLLSEYCKKVYLIYRGDKIHAEPINAKRVEENNKIEKLSNTNVKEIKGNNKVEKLMLDMEFDGSAELEIDGIFIEIGHLPQTLLARDLGVELNEKGEIKIDRASRTSLHGFFAAGDVTDSGFKQAITGASEGVRAANSAYECITGQKCDWGN